MHKMKAFVRFRPVAAADGGEPLHIAWFEPDHHIVDAVRAVLRAPLRRHALVDPDAERSAALGRRAARIRPRRRRARRARRRRRRGAVADLLRAHLQPGAAEAGARCSARCRASYWHNLPEAELIAPLAAPAHARSGHMIAAAPTAPAAACRAAHGRAAHPLAAARQPASSTRLREAAASAAATARSASCATQTVFGEGPAGARADARRRAARRPGRPAAAAPSSARPASCSTARSPSSAGRAIAGLRHQRGQALQVRAARQAPHAQDAAQREVDACLHWLESEIALVQPQAIVALGATAARQLLGRPVAVTRERGHWLRTRRRHRRCW